MAKKTKPVTNSSAPSKVRTECKYLVTNLGLTRTFQFEGLGINLNKGQSIIVDKEELAKFMESQPKVNVTRLSE